MQRIKKMQNNTAALLALVVIAALFYALVRMGQLYDGELFAMATLQSFKTIFLGILLEALPFILIGSFVSSIIQIFVTEESLAKIIPKNAGLGIVTAALLGFAFPICECAIIPVIRRLIKKGVPLSMAIAFMLAAPILNPVVLASTYYAFSAFTEIVIMRAAFGFIIAVAIAAAVKLLFKGNQLTGEENPHHHHHHDCCSHGAHSHGEECHSHEQKEDNHSSSRLLGGVVEVMEHTSSEFFDVGKYLIFGAILSALVQTIVPRSSLIAIGQGPVSSVLLMLSLAFILSLCSEADAFVARSFLSQFTTGSIMGFLVLGPMLDIKNTLMLLGTFKKKFVLSLMALIFFFTFTMAIILNMAGI